MLGIRMFELRILLISCGSVNGKMNECVKDAWHETGTVRFEELDDGPDSDMLERCVWARQEAV